MKTNALTISSYDSLGRPAEIKSMKSGFTVMDYVYGGYDKVGNITARTTARDRYVPDEYGLPVKTAETGANTYSYDSLYRLTGATGTAASAETFGYDSVGNRTSSADASGWSYLADNSLFGYTGANSVGVVYTYDDNGNVSTKTEGGAVTTFHFGAADRLDSVDLPDGRTATYTYDPFGRRVAKTVTTVVNSVLGIV